MIIYLLILFGLVLFVGLLLFAIVVMDLFISFWLSVFSFFRSVFFGGLFVSGSACFSFFASGWLAM